MGKITVVDSIMGSGKSSYFINKMNEINCEKNYIYITPYLSELQRLKGSIDKRKFYEPTNGNAEGTKLRGLKNLIIQGKDICSTHALFKNIDEEILRLLKPRLYTLILDEVLDIIETISIGTDDLDMLIDKNILKIDKNTNKIIWLNSDYVGRFSDIKTYAEQGTLYYHSRNGNKKSGKLLVWLFPKEIFDKFEEVYILTYMFDGSLFKSYLDLNNMKYEYKSIRKVENKYEMVQYIHLEKEDKSEIRKLITVYDGKLNNIGDEETSLSVSWFNKKKNLDMIKLLKNNIQNYYKNIVKSKSKDNLWTCVKGEKERETSKGKIRSLLEGKGYSKAFVPINCRATNEYSDRKYIAYIANRYMNPLDIGFFKDKGINSFNEELWALSEMIQFIWRSTIRNNEPINIYIPSSRMRNIFLEWLNCDLTK